MRLSSFKPVLGGGGVFPAAALFVSTAGAYLAGFQNDFRDFHLIFSFLGVSYKGEPLSELPMVLLFRTL